MATIGDLVVNLGLNAQGYKRGLQDSRGELGGFVGFATRNLGKLVAASAGALGAASSIGAAREQIAAKRKLEAVLKATGGAAGLTANQIADYASELQSMTNFGDEATIGAASMLATFKNIKGDQFKQTLAAAQDLSTVMGGDLNSAVTQLGKALNDPTQGLSALRRVGVSFTDQQQQQIKALQQSGELMAAQKIILGELQSQFGGAAASVADPFTQAKNVLGDVAELVGFTLKPAFDELMGIFVDGAGTLTTHREKFEALGASIASVVRDGLQPLAEGFGTVANFIGDAAGHIAFTVRNGTDGALLALTDLQGYFLNTGTEIGAVISNWGVNVFAFGSTVAEIFTTIVDGAEATIREVAQLLPAHFDGVLAAYNQLWDNMRGVGDGRTVLQAYLDTAVPAIAALPDIPGGLDFSDDTTLADIFNKHRETALASLPEANSGTLGRLAKEREELLGRINKREALIAPTLKAPDLGRGGPDINTPGSGGQQFEVKANKALQIDSAEGFAAAIQATQFQPSTTEEKTEQHLAELLDQTEETTEAVRETNTLLRTKLTTTETRRLS